MFVGQLLEDLKCRSAVGVQPVKARLAREINIFGINHLRDIALQRKGAKLAVTAQALVEQRLLLFDHPCFEQQRSQFSRGARKGYAARLAQKGRFIRGAEVGHHAGANVDAFTDVERHNVALAVENIDSRLPGQAVKPWPEVFRIFIDRRGFELQPRRICSPYHI
ncbi:hypothetical protein HMPREF0201_01683 [Cedecea davisae DSM 4568]|uniref:Uncharacterized protein n=1 Tax=Cedecea davisae DSM 4568 TaxID=566551 RepID=S3IVG6_9ENTR|nr:hypothetical protein HMPREF0201_01683 [Cedecea davisae DSM 4568]